ncbi:hypothetical protein LEP1GSC123_0597 [Leptospira borgpetersenii str. 200701203]|uniref:Lipoprotein n=1 Tax=Leptospira borgpetersenii str. 200701203 TaxID=1193007 RepID=M3HT22_LEPBO|nr:hypothetical protein LEP1GSC123_0597 [Leptospira borgpetersenii str. 200701203]
MTLNTKIITLVIASFLLSVCASGQKSEDSNPSLESAIRSKIQGIDFQLSSSSLDEKNVLPYSWKKRNYCFKWKLIRKRLSF